MIAMQYNMANMSSESGTKLVWSDLKLSEAPFDWFSLQSTKNI